MSISTNLARNTVRQLIELGIEDAVLSPGSRNAPLSIALYQAEQKGLIRLHVRIDERGAAFFALGISKATEKYVPVICTSGTAVANYYPAVLESHHSDNNLLLLTADRPARLRKTGSNQTTLQGKIFGEFVRHSVDTASPIDLAHLLNGSGPVHINLQFDEPLLPEDSIDWLAGIHHKELAPTPTHKTQIDVISKRNIVIVGHDRAGFSENEIEKLARDLGAPLIAEDPLRFKDAIAHSPIVLSDKRVRNELKPELAIVIGRTTLSRSTNAYLGFAEKTLVIDPRAKTIDSARHIGEIFEAIPVIKTKVNSDQSWLRAWKVFESVAAQAIFNTSELSEGLILANLVASINRGTALFVSSSRPIRDLEAFAKPRDGLFTFANRGLAGIDGNLSTAMGIATRFEKSIAVVGDLAFLHDISAFINPIKERFTIIVIDNNGGGIFSTIETVQVDGFEKVFGTPHNHELSKIVSGFGISVVTVYSIDDLINEYNKPTQGLRVIVVRCLSRHENAIALNEIHETYSSLLTRRVLR